MIRAWLLQFIIGVLECWDDDFEKRTQEDKVKQAMWVLEEMKL